MKNALNKHLDEIRKKAHDTQRKNGHFEKMTNAKLLKNNKKK